MFSPGIFKVGDGGRDGSEIDIVTSARVNDRVNHSFHWDGFGKDHRTEAKPTILPGITDGFHTFGLLWNPEEYVFYMDHPPCGSGDEEGKERVSNQGLRGGIDEGGSLGVLDEQVREVEARAL
jgi:hypothetical protein